MLAPGYHAAAVIIALLFSGAAGAWTAIRQRRKHKAVQGWDKVRGRIRESRTSEIVEERDGGPVTRFEPLVLYDYRFDGQDYVGTRIGLDPADNYATRAEAQRRVKRYVEGHEIEILVDPAHPNRALLDPRIKAGWTTPAIALATLAALLAFTVFVALNG